MMIYGAGFVQVFVIPSEPVVESNLPVWSSCWNYGFGTLCRSNIAEPMPFGTKTQKDYIQIHGRKIDKFTVQFVSWSQYMVRTFLTGGTSGFSSVLKWLAVPLPLHSPQQCMVFSPPARWGLLDFMSVAASSCLPPAASCLVLLLLVLLVLLVVLVVLVQLRSAIHSNPCRTSTTTIPAQCSLPDLNHDHPRPVFPAGPQPRPSTPSVPCRTSTASIPAQCSLPDLHHDHPRPVFPAGPQPRVSLQKICHIECQKICQMEC